MKQNKLIELFYASLNSKWYSAQGLSKKYNYSMNDTRNYYSEKYGDYHFNLDNKNGKLYVYEPTSKKFTELKRYLLWYFIPIDIRIFKAMLNVKKQVLKDDEEFNENRLSKREQKIFDSMNNDKSMLVNLRKNKLEKISDK